MFTYRRRVFVSHSYLAFFDGDEQRLYKQQQNHETLLLDVVMHTLTRNVHQLRAPHHYQYKATGASATPVFQLVVVYKLEQRERLAKNTSALFAVRRCFDASNVVGLWFCDDVRKHTKTLIMAYSNV